jgi:purine-binding chemotaxis protein CheW
MNLGPTLLVATGSLRCAIPVAHVAETMRPLPVDTVAGGPAFVLGLAVIRGKAVPVVDLLSVVGVGRTVAPSRFVVLKVGQRRVALAVGAVLGIRALDRAGEAAPPLLRDACADVVEAIGVLDSQLLFVLRASRLLSEEAWQRLATLEATA